MGKFHDDEEKPARIFDPIHDTNHLIGLIATGNYLGDEDFAYASPFVLQMNAVLRKLCQAWVLNHHQVEHLLGPTFYQVMKELALDAYRCGVGKK